jgi:hypothetical protein
MKNLEAQMKLNEAAQRYADLLTVLSDTVISDEEVSVLAQKWNVTKGEVLEYIARIYAANSTDITDGPIVNLLMKWGLTKDEAEKYVDFTRALKDEKIDDKEIEELMGKWGMTRAQVLAYAKTVQDGTALQAALSKSYALPGDEAAEAWKRALGALNDYLAALKKTTPSTTPTPTPSITPPVIPPVIPTIIPPVIPSNIPTIISGTQGAGTGSTQVPSGIELPGRGSALEFIPTDMTNPNLYGPGKIPFAAYSGIADSFGAGNNAGTPNINITVQGSVTSENDLVETIRTGLLVAQGSGSSILYSARAI